MTIFRTDQDAPVLDIQTESDVTSILNSYAARQPDSDHFRLWEVAGTARADAHLVGANAKDLDCGVPINNGPMHIVAKAALRALTTWLTTGQAPVKAQRGRTLRRSACSSGRRNRSPKSGSHSCIRRPPSISSVQGRSDATIKAGFALPQDRAALLAFAEPARVRG